MAYIDRTLTVRSLAPQGKRPPFLFLAVLIFLPVVAWGVNDFDELQAAIESYDGTTDVIIEVADDIDITSTLIIFPTSAGGTLTIKSKDGELYTLRRATASNLFTLNSGTLTLKNITIDGNIETYPNNNTSIIVVVGSLVMESGTVLKNNRGGGQGGSGVLVNAGGTFTMNGGEISGNTVTSYGGGVCVNSNNGTFTMNGGKISGNTAGSYGGGVYLSFNGNSSNASFTMNGGEISGNTVPAGEGSYGGGVGFSYGTLTLGGMAKIFGNTKDGVASNVYSREGTHINLGTNANAPQAGMRVYIQTTDAEGVIVESGATAGAEQYFYAEEDGKAVAFESGQLIIKNIEDISPIISFPQLKAAISAGRNTIIIGNSFDITEPLSNPGSSITIKSDGTIRTLTRYITGYLFSLYSGKFVFENIIIDGNKDFFSDNTNALVFILGENAEFEMREGTVLQNNAGSGVQKVGGSFIMSGGIISGNTATTGCGGVSGSFIMSGGTISGNTATGDGGGVCGCPSMSGGTISGNTATGRGGGVRVSDGCTFTMTGGEISGNSAADGGGVFVSSSINPGPNTINKGTFTMTGGKINGNTATNGGGVYVEKEGSFIVGGTAKILNNTKSGEANNVYLNNERYITLGTDNAPQSGMQVYVQTETDSRVIVNSGATANDAQYFYADENGKAVAFESSDKLIIPIITTFGQLRAAIEAEESSIIIGKSFAITEPLTIANNSNITIRSENNEPYTLTRGTGSSLFTVNSGELKLEDIIIDGNNTATINPLISIKNDGSLVMEHGAVLQNARGSGNPTCSAVGVAGGTFTMNGGEISGNTSTSIGGGVYVDGTFTMTGGKISGNTAPSNGGGVFVGNYGTFTMNGGEISGNTATGSGGGVVVNMDGTFTMSGGEISGNTTGTDGGGVYIASSTIPNFRKGTFIMNGGEISGNSATGSGGGVYAGSGTFTMTGGEISGNTADNGGGVYVASTIDGTNVYKGTFEMTGGEIKDNTQGSGGGCGGGVFVDADGTFTMTGGEISGNTADNGGGVFVNTSTFTMSGGEIKDNTAYSGGGVFVQEEGAFFTMSGGEISGNTVSYSAGGVYFEAGTFIVGGTAKILNNTKSGEANNVYLNNERYITLGTDNAPQSGMQVYVQTATDSRVIVNSGATANDAQYFYADENSKAVVFQPNQLIIKNSIPTASITLTAPKLGVTPSPTATGTGNFTSTVTWSENPSMFLGKAYTATVTLTANSGYTFARLETATINEQTATVTNNTGNSVTLSYTFPKIDASIVTDGPELKAAVLTYEGTTSDNIIKIGNDIDFGEENLTIKNTNITIKSIDGETYTIIRGVTGNIFTVKENGTLVFENIIIDASNAVAHGPIVFVDDINAEFEMKNGAVLRGNTLTTGDDGGGVYVENGTFRMSGGEISGNSAPLNGGGVYVQSGTTFIMTGGEIKNNSVTACGGGVFVYGTFIMSGGTISGNNANDEGGGVAVYSTFTMSGGIISGNTTTVGGGVFVDMSKTFTVGGTAKILNNTGDGAGNNVYLNHTYLYLGTGADTPKPGMEVYVQTATASGVIVDTDATEDDAQYFYADLNGKAVAYENNQLIIKNAISTATISLTAPETGEIPNKEATTSHANFEVGPVTWEGNPPKFSGSTQYTATVTLTAKDGYTFTRDLTATIDMWQANVIENTGNTATISHTFHETTPLAITEFKVTKQPAKLKYTYGDRFDWSGLEVKLTYTDKTTENVAYENFEDRNITVREDDATAMDIGDNIEITIQCGSHTDFVYLTVGKAKLTITANDTTITYGDAAPTYTASYSGLVNKETASVLTGGTITSDYKQNDNAGKYTITASGYSSANYDINHINGTLIVGKRDLSNVEIAEIEPVIYTGEEYKPTPQVSDGNITITTDDYTFSYSDNINAGTATLTLTPTENGNYTGTKTANFQINEKPFVPLKMLIITANDTTITYGDSIPEYTVTITGIEDGEDDLIGGTITSNYKQGDNVGEYIIKPSGYTSENYEITFVNGTLTVAPAELAFVSIDTITVDEGLTLAQVKLPEGYAWDDSTIVLEAGDHQPFEATYTLENYKEAQGTIIINVAKKESKHVIMMTAVIAPSDTNPETETIEFEKQKDLSTDNKTVFFANTNSCEIKTIDIQIAVTDPSLKLKVNDELLTEGKEDHNNNFTLYNKTLALSDSGGFNTLVYDFSNGQKDTAIIVSPIPFDKIIKQKWGLLIVNSDTATNGGYNLSKYNWFRNGEEIVGDTLAYRRLELNERSNPTDNLFYVKLKTKDNIPLNSCEGSPTAQPPTLESQGAYKKQVLGINGKTANGKIYNIKGKLSTKNAPPGVYIVEEKQ